MILQNLPILPIALGMCFGMLGFLPGFSLAVRRAVSVVGALSILGAAIWLLVTVWEQGTLVTQMGNWAAPYGISFVADKTAALLVLLVAVVGVGVLVYAMGAIDEKRERAGFHPLYFCLLTAVMGSFTTGDIFNMYVWFEIMLLSSFVLITLGGERAQLEGAIKYVTLNLISSTLFLSAIGLLYGVAGTLNLAHLSVVLADVDEKQVPLITTIAMLFFIGFAIKGAIWPFFFWLPASYHTPPPVIAAVFAALLTKVGAYAIIRTFTLVFTLDAEYIFGYVLMPIATVGMLSGVLGAACQYETRRILAFHSVSQIGYILMGLAIAGLANHNAGVAEAAGNLELASTLDTAAKLALGGSIYFIIHHAIVKMNLFLIAGMMLRRRGSSDLRRIGSLYNDTPGLAFLFFITSMALAGIPILSGFWAKLALVRAGLMAENYLIVGVSLFVGCLTLYSMTKIWLLGYMKNTPEYTDDNPAPEPIPTTRKQWTLMAVPVAGYMLIAVLMGVFIGPVFDACYAAASELLQPQAYIDAVLVEPFEHLDVQSLDVDQLITEAAADVSVHPENHEGAH